MQAGLGRALRSGRRRLPVLLGRCCSPPSAPQLVLLGESDKELTSFICRELLSVFVRKTDSYHCVREKEMRKHLYNSLHYFFVKTTHEFDLGQSLKDLTLKVGLWRHTGAWRCREGAPYSTLVPSDEVTISYRHGLPVITLMLPTRSERCQFTVKPVVTTVGAFLQDVQREDKGIERAEVFATDGTKVSHATLMEILLMSDFKLVINNTAYNVSPPVKDKLSSEHATEMEDIKSLVHRLFVALHLEDHQIRKERELLQKLDHLKGELLPLEQMKARIVDSADAKTSRLLWVGLALMSTQGGALAWLTWWVYSWDIMEPVTYFITYGSAMAFYAYFVLTKQDYIYPQAKDRQFLHYFYRKSKKQRFNVERYNKLKEELAEAEESLRRLRQPLHLRLPIQEISDKD